MELYKRMPEGFFPDNGVSVDDYFESEWDGRIYLREPIKVWVVLWAEYDDTELRGVFTDESKARAVADASQCYVVERVLDEVPKMTEAQTAKYSKS